jgi:hypothetical protein
MFDVRMVVVLFGVVAASMPSLVGVFASIYVL